MTLQNLLLFLLLGIAKASEKSNNAPVIVGEGLSRIPESGKAKIGDELKCLKDGEEVDDLEWVVIKGETASVMTPEDGKTSIKASEKATYQCKIDEETYAEFVVAGEDNSLHFRVDKFEKSYAVVEQEDLKIECKISNRTDQIDIKNDIKIKWYMFNITGITFYSTFLKLPFTFCIFASGTAMSLTVLVTVDPPYPDTLTKMS